MKPVLGNVVAMADEARLLLGRRNWRCRDRWRVLETTLHGGTRLLSVQSGMGLENAFAAASWLVSQDVSSLVVMGVSGGLNPALRVGDIVLADGIIEEQDMANRDVWKTDKARTDFAYDTLCHAGVSVARGSILTATQPLLAPRQKTDGFQTTNALAVDMESSAIARVANDAGIPLFVMRAVCDPADTAVPGALFDVVGATGSIRWSKLLVMLLRRPLFMIDIVDRGKEFHSALRALKRGWRLLVEHHLPSRLVSR